MYIYEVLRRILAIVFLITLFTMISLNSVLPEIDIKSEKRKDVQTEGGKESLERDSAQEIFSAAALFVIFVLFAVLCNFCYDNPKRSLAILAPLLILLPISIGQSIPVIKNLFREGDNNKLSLRENKVMFNIAFFVILIDVYDIIQRVIESILTYDKPIYHDILLSCVYSGLLVLYLVLIVILGTEALELILVALKRVFIKMPGKEKIKNFHERLIIQTDVSNVKYRPLTPVFWKKTRNWFAIFRFLAYIPLFLIAIIDISVRVLEILIKIVPYLGCLFFELCRLVKGGLSWLVDFLISLSKKRVLRIAIRVSLVVAFLCVVITNRYHPLFLLYEESTAIYEFMASVIIIPIIIDGITSLQERKREANKK